MSKFINDLRTRVTRSYQWECELCEGRQPVKVTKWIWVLRGFFWAAVGAFVYARVRSVVQPDSGAVDAIYWWFAAILAAGLALWLQLLRDAEAAPAPRRQGGALERKGLHE